MGCWDVLVNYARSCMFGPIDACSVYDFRLVIEVNYFGLINVTQAALPLLRASKVTLINIASMAAFLAMGGTAPYTASKHAVLGVTEALHEELSPLGVQAIGSASCRARVCQYV